MTVPMVQTTPVHTGSGIIVVVAVAALGLLVGCAKSPPAFADDDPTTSGNNSVSSEPAPVEGNRTSSQPDDDAASCLGVADTGVFSDLDSAVQIALPADLAPRDVTATIDAERSLLVVFVADWATKVYPLGGDATLQIGREKVSLRPRDLLELSGLLEPGNVAAGSSTIDRDADGIPDPLDVLIGARKTVLNGAAYQGGYLQLDYPNGDVPRDVGVCTDVVIRAARNAGLDIQAELQRDIRRSPKSYPMVKGSGDSNIDHRRVKTLLPYFKRQWEAHSAALDDAADPLRPGDVVFLDTFPDRHGPDHIGIISDRIADSGKPYVINNWTDGTVTAEMDLLDWVPVTHRFRIK